MLEGLSQKNDVPSFALERGHVQFSKHCSIPFSLRVISRNLISHSIVTNRRWARLTPAGGARVHAGLFRAEEGLAIMADDFAFSIADEDAEYKAPTTDQGKGLSGLLAQQPRPQGSVSSAGPELCSVCHDVS